MAEPLFTDPVHLSELHTYPAADSLYVLGEVLAEWNRVGHFFYPDFLRNFMFHRNNGRWMMIKAKNLHEGELDPEVVSWQFRGEVSETRQEFLAGFLGGYVRRAYQIIEPDHPGFVKQLLAHLVKGPILSITKPRDLQLNLSKILAHYGWQVDYKKNKPTFVEVPRQEQECNDYELAVATIVLALGQLDVRQWIKRIEKLNAHLAVPQLLGALARHEDVSSWDGMIADLFQLKKKQIQFEELLSYQPAPITGLLCFPKQYFELKKVPEEDLFGECVKILKNTIATLVHYKVTDYYIYVEAIADGLEYLAQRADEQGARMESITLAQNAAIMLQLVANEVTGLEARLARAEMQGYTWINLKATDTPEEDNLFKKYIPLNYIACRNSQSKTHLLSFATSHKLFQMQHVTNHLWTALWVNRNSQRHSLLFLNELAPQTATWAEAEKQHYFYMLQDTFKTYYNGQQQFTDALVSYFQENRILSHYTNCFTGKPEEDAQTFLQVEQAASVRFHETLENGKLDEKTLSGLQDLVAAIERVK